MERCRSVPGSPRLDDAALPLWRRGEGDPARLAAAANRWYGGHALRLQAERFRSLLAP